jgi:hypothetical protein
MHMLTQAAGPPRGCPERSTGPPPQRVGGPCRRVRSSEYVQYVPEESRMRTHHSWPLKLPCSAVCATLQRLGSPTPQLPRGWRQQWLEPPPPLRSWRHWRLRYLPALRPRPPSSRCRSVAITLPLVTSRCSCQWARLGSPWWRWWTPVSPACSRPAPIAARAQCPRATNCTTPQRPRRPNLCRVPDHGHVALAARRAALRHIPAPS